MFGFASAAPTHASEDDTSSARHASLFAASFCLALGISVLLGWSNEIEILKRIRPGFVAMNPTTAICIMLAGISLALQSHRFRRSAMGAGVALSMIAAAKLADYVFGGIPVDRLLFGDQLDLGDGSLPNRMAPNTALAFLLCGIAQALAAIKRHRAAELSQLLGIAVLVISMFALIGYAFSIHHLRGVGPFIPMALHTAAALIVIGSGIVSQTRTVGVMLVLRDPGPAGSMARTVLPLAVAIPIAVGAVRLLGQNHGYYGTEAGVALQVLANVVVTSALLSTSIFALYRSDQIRKEREQALRESEQFNRTINQASPDCVSLLDPDGMVVFANDAALRAYGLGAESDLLGRPWGHRLDGSLGDQRDAALATARAGGVGRLTTHFDDAAGEPRWFESLISRLTDAEEQVIQFIVMARDITHQKRVEDQVRWTATHDSLTRLPNRSLFQARLDQLADGGAGAGFALLLLDIDDFKRVNDTLGHDAGDALLSTVAERLRSAIRPEDFIARLGGDEFAVILNGVRSEAGAAAAGEKMLETLREPWVHNGRVGDCRVSIGASLWPHHGEEPTDLLKSADIALYVAKVQERGRLAIFRAEMRAEMQRRSSKIALARYALDEDLIAPFYQPKVELISGKLIGFEALLRWRHPTQGVQMPATIDAAFEDLELARQLTDRILTHVLSDMRRWVDAGVDFGHVAINVTAADFKQKNFAELLLERLDSHGLPSCFLQVEVTETVFLGRGAEYVEDALRTLSANGIRIALDDFGTGYASLSHLKQFPVDVVKIDRSFLRDIHDDAHNAAIIRTVVSLGRSLDLDVVAEGVETIDQQSYLIGQGCRLGQGYLYGKAAPAARVPGLVTSAAARAAEAGKLRPLAVAPAPMSVRG